LTGSSRGTGFEADPTVGNPDLKAERAFAPDRRRGAHVAPRRRLSVEGYAKAP
jgi:hypothetical protein